MNIVKILSTDNYDYPLSVCTQGNLWILPYKCAYIFELTTSSNKEKEKPCYVTRSPKFEVLGDFQSEPYMVNLCANMKRKDLDCKCFVWLNLYMGPGIIPYEYTTPYGSREAPF